MTCFPLQPLPITQLPLGYLEFISTSYSSGDATESGDIFFLINQGSIFNQYSSVWTSNNPQLDAAWTNRMSYYNLNNGGDPPRYTRSRTYSAFWCSAGGNIPNYTRAQDELHMRHSQGKFLTSTYLGDGNGVYVLPANAIAVVGIATIVSTGIPDAGLLNGLPPDRTASDSAMTSGRFSVWMEGISGTVTITGAESYMGFYSIDVIP